MRRNYFSLINRSETACIYSHLLKEINEQKRKPVRIDRILF